MHGCSCKQQVLTAQSSLPCCFAYSPSNNISPPRRSTSLSLLQALFCIGDLVWGHAQLQEQLAGQLAGPAHSAVAGLGGKAAAAAQPIPYLQVGTVGELLLTIVGPDEHACKGLL